MGENVDKLLNYIEIPEMVNIKQSFPDDSLDDVGKEVQEKIKVKNLLERINPGDKVAVTAGSRGIADLPLVIKEVVKLIRSVPAEPFLIPAMGSHGGATAAGQKSLLAGMGITEETVKAPIKASMEVVQVGRTDSGLPVYIDKHAAAADAIVIVNRIKQHVAFHGDYESGLMKMITIGLGKQRGAEVCHNLGFGQMEKNIVDIAGVVLNKVNLIFGIGILENERDETRKVVALGAEEIKESEPDLLKEAKAHTAGLPFEEIDVLIIDEIGKDICGTGLDTNVVGRYHTPYADDGTGPDINKMGVLDLTEKSHGNANGIGIVDYTTNRLFQKMDFEQTYPNSLTSTVAQSIKIPMVLESDKQVFQAGIKCCNLLDKSKARIVRIKNTLQLEKMWISKTLLPEVKSNESLEILSEPQKIDFDNRDNLI